VCVRACRKNAQQVAGERREDFGHKPTPTPCLLSAVPHLVVDGEQGRVQGFQLVQGRSRRDGRKGDARRRGRQGWERGRGSGWWGCLVGSSDAGVWPGRWRRLVGG
jgi:hypothetical protein